MKLRAELVAVILVMSCGLRLEDACILKWSSVDFDRMIIRCVPVKTKRTGKFVTLYIHDALFNVLSQRKRDGDLILPSLAARHGRDASTLCRDIEKLFNAIGLYNPDEVEGHRVKAVAKYGFHSLRHTYVSLSADAGVPIHMVQSAVGHGSPEMTRRYLHHQIDGMKAASDALKLTD